MRPFSIHIFFAGIFYFYLITHSLGQSKVECDSLKHAAGLLYTRNDFKNALPLFLQAEKCTKDAQVYFFIGRCCLEDSLYEKGILYFNKFDSAYPSPYFWSYSNRGACYRNLKEYGRALENYNRAIELYEEWKKQGGHSEEGWILYSNRADLFFKTKKYAKAEIERYKAIKEYPFEIENYLDLYELLVLENKTNDLNTIKKKALALNPTLGQLLIVLFYQYANRIMNGVSTYSEENQLNIQLNKDFTVDWYFDDFDQYLRAVHLNPQALRKIKYYEKEILDKNGKFQQHKADVITRSIDSVRLLKLPALLVQSRELDGLDMATFISPGAETLDHNNNFHKYLPSHTTDSSTCLSQMHIITHSSGIVTVWDAISGQVVRRLNNVTRITDLAIAEDGINIITADILGKIRVWNMATGKIIQEFKDCSRLTAISPNGQQVMVVGQEDNQGNVKKASGIYSVATGELLFPINTFRRYIEFVIFSPDGRMILLIDSKGIIEVYDLSDRKTLIRNLSVGVKNGFFSSDNKMVILYGDSLVKERTDTVIDMDIYASKGGILEVWQLSNDRKIFNLSGTEKIENVLLTPGDSCLLIDKGEGKVERWNVLVHKKVYTILPEERAVEKRDDSEKNSEQAYKTSLTEDGKNIITIGQGKLLQWDAVSGSKMRELNLELPGEKYIKTISLSPNADQALIHGGLLSDDCYLIDTRNGKMTKRLAYNQGIQGATAVGFSKNGSKFLWRGDGLINEIDSKSSGRLAYQFKNTASAQALFLSESGDILFNNGTCYQVDKDSILSILPIRSGLTSHDFSVDDSLLLLGYEDGSFEEWNLAQGHLVFSKKINIVSEILDSLGSTSVRKVSFSPDKKVMAVAYGKFIYLYNQKGNLLQRILMHKKSNTENISSICFSVGSDKLAAGLGNGNFNVWDLNGNLLKTYEKDLETELWTLGDEIVKIYFVNDNDFLMLSKNGRFTAHTLKEGSHFNIRPDHEVKDMTMAFGEGKKIEGSYLLFLGAVNDMDLSHRRNELVTVGADGWVKIWDCATGHMVSQLNISIPVLSAKFSNNDRKLLVGAADGSVHIWDRSANKEICKFVVFTDSSWAVFTSDGRFDTNDPENLPGLNWSFPDDPFSALPPETFMRDYYTPGLLSKVFAKDSLPSFGQGQLISDLNRIQPIIRDINVIAQPDSQCVSVAVSVASGKQHCRPSDTTQLTESGVYDIRLFRNGVLVSEKPDSIGQTLDIDASISAGQLNLTHWRKNAEVRLEGDSLKILFKNIRLSKPSGQKEVEFAAYAFNADRVKSLTRKVVYKLPDNFKMEKPRLFLIAIGVSATENGWNLASPVDDARGLVELILDRLRHLFQTVIPIKLLSTRGGMRKEEILATKENIRYVLALLSRKDKGILPLLPNTLPSELIDSLAAIQPIVPGDEVLITFSGHGFATPNSLFYLVPENTGEIYGIRPEDVTAFLEKKTDSSQITRVSRFIQNCISSAELSAWVRQIDAENLNLVIDACYSGAIVGSEQQFRPGPMGDPGFGQLAYDKKVRIITATQSEERSIGNLHARYGLLTYALMEYDFANAFQVSMDFHGWFEYASKKVPALYKKYYPNSSDKLNQIPVLYDFHK